MPMSRSTGPFAPRSLADHFYFELETLLDTWRRRGVPDDVIRSGLARAERASFAMEGVGKLFKGTERIQG